MLRNSTTYSPGTTVLLFEEATSYIDTRTELLVQKAMPTMRADRTSFVIARRLSTTSDADVILVREHGDIAEQGGGSELIALGGSYAALYQSQFAAIEVWQTRSRRQPIERPTSGHLEDGMVHGLQVCTADPKLPNLFIGWQFEPNLPGCLALKTRSRCGCDCAQSFARWAAFEAL